MELLPVFIGILLLLAIGGAGMETFFPGFFSKKLQSDLSALTVATLGILTSILFLMVFLKVRIREGFQDEGYSSRWNSMVTESRVVDVCKLYTEVFEKIMKVEKGAPPEPLKTDSQAREATEKLFTDQMTTNLLSCAVFNEVEASKNKLDTFFETIMKLSDSFLIQVYETAVVCRSLLINQYTKVQEAEKEREEGFQNPVCSDAAAKERREFKERNTLSKEAQTCVLVEEIPHEKKTNAILQKLDRMQSKFNQYRVTAKTQDSIQKILEDALYYKNELDKRTNEAVETSNKYKFK